MSRFPAVAGRAPRRQEEGERPIELQEERPSAVRIADREEKGCTSQEGGTTPTFPIQKQRKKAHSSCEGQLVPHRYWKYRKW